MQTGMAQQITNTISTDFPEETKRLQAGKPLTKTQEKNVQAYILGIMRGYMLCGQVIPPYMYINYQCGRLDRLFTAPKPVDPMDGVIRIQG